MIAGARRMAAMALVPALAGWSVPVGAQALPNPFALLPDMVGPVDPGRPEQPVFQPQLPPETPAEVQAIDLAQPVTTLADALVRAYWFNPALQAERARLRSADLGLPEARGQFGPRLDYAITFDWRRDRVDDPLAGPVPARRAGHSSSIAAIVTQPLLTFGRLAAGERAARAQIAFQRAVLRDAEQRVLGEAVAAYIGLLRDRAAVQIARDDSAILDQELRDAQARFAVRETTAADLAQVESRAAISRAGLAVVQAALVASEARFRAVTGSPPGELAIPAPLQPAAASLADAQALAFEQNPLLEAARAREQVSRALADRARAERLPRIEAQGRAAVSPTTDYDNSLRQRSLQGGVVISGPVFDSGVLAARQAAAEAVRDADWRLIDAAMRDVQADVAAAWATRDGSRQAVGPLAQAVEQAQRAYEAARIQQRAGLRSTLDVLILARDLLNVRSSYNALLADAYLADVSLLAATGQLDAARLLPQRPAYDPALHLERVDGRGDIPLWTPLLDSIDGLGWPGPVRDQPVRDPALVPAA